MSSNVPSDRSNATQSGDDARNSSADSIRRGVVRNIGEDQRASREGGHHNEEASRISGKQGQSIRICEYSELLDGPCLRIKRNNIDDGGDEEERRVDEEDRIALLDLAAGVESRNCPDHGTDVGRNRTELNLYSSIVALCTGANPVNKGLQNNLLDVRERITEGMNNARPWPNIFMKT